MANWSKEGRPFHGEFSSADASALSEANSRYTLYDSSKAPITLAANERVLITDLFILAGAALTVTIYDGADTTVAAGEKIFGPANYGANGGVNAPFQTPHFCKNNASISSPVGYPKVKTSGAGQIDSTIHGVIIKEGQ